MLDQLWQAGLPANATRYYWMRAAPDVATTRVVWATWVVVSAVCAFAGLIIIAGILSSVAARRNAFNQYIIALIIPDVFFSSSCAVTCALNWLASTYFGGPMWCSWQSFYVIFGFSGSIWMQVVIASEIRGMVHCVHEQRAYSQPTTCKVTAQVACIYALSAFWACWIFLGTAYGGPLPIKENAIGGLACMPVPYSFGSEMFLWGAFLIPVALLPLCIVGGIVLGTRHMHALLDDKTLALLGFFSTILAVLLFMWVPSIVLIYLLEPRGHGLWVAFGGGTWSHVQGLVSASIYLRKPDVRQAVSQLPLLQCLVRPWLRLTSSVSVVRRLVDCVEDSLLPVASVRRRRNSRDSQQLSGVSGMVSEWAALSYIQNDVEVCTWDSNSRFQLVRRWQSLAPTGMKIGMTTGMCARISYLLR